MLWVLRMDPRFKVFYSCYNRTIFVIFNTDGYDRAAKFKVYRDGNVIFEGAREEFHHPEEFDHDKHTELYFKLSKHELCYHDTAIQDFQTYSYYVEYIDDNDYVLLQTRIKIVKVE